MIKCSFFKWSLFTFRRCWKWVQTKPKSTPTFKLFERINSRAETLARVRKKSLELIESMDSDTYKGLETSFVRWLELTVADRSEILLVLNSLTYWYVCT